PSPLSGMLGLQWRRHPLIVKGLYRRVCHLPMNRLADPKRRRFLVSVHHDYVDARFFEGGEVGYPHRLTRMRPFRGLTEGAGINGIKRLDRYHVKLVSLLSRDHSHLRTINVKSNLIKPDFLDVLVVVCRNGSDAYCYHDQHKEHKNNHVQFIAVTGTDVSILAFFGHGHLRLSIVCRSVRSKKPHHKRERTPFNPSQSQLPETISSIFSISSGEL